MSSRRTNSGPLLLAVLLAAAPSAPASGTVAAQEPATLLAGERVRLALREQPDRWLIGTVIGQTGDSLRLDERGSRTILAVPTAHLAALQVSRGRRSHTALGALIGFGAGAAFGIIATAATPAINTDVRGYALVAGIFGGMGAGAGALVGWAVQSERWEPPLPLRVSPRTVPTGAVRRPVLGLSLQF